MTGFIGANGAGKTTVIRLIMDLMQCDSGSISILGDSMINNPIDLKNKIGFVYSETYFNEKWSIKKLESIISPFYKNGIKIYFNIIYINLNYHINKNQSIFYRYENEIVSCNCF